MNTVHDIFTLLGSIVILAVIATVLSHGKASIGILDALRKFFVGSINAAQSA